MRWIAFACITFAAISARADAGREARAVEEAEQAVLAMREVSYLPTICEKAFDDFWSLYRAPGRKGMLREPSVLSPRDYFGHGNLDAAPLLGEAQQVCAEQTGARGDLVVRVLEERAKKHLRRANRARASELLIKGY